MEQQLLAAVTDAVIVTDLEARITFWNHGAEKLYGFSFDEVRGRYIVDIIPPRVRSGDPVVILDRIREGKSWAGEFVTSHKDGSSLTTSIINSPLRDARGEVVGVIGIARDMTMVRELGRAHQHSESVSRAMLEAVPDLVFRLSERGEYLNVRANQSHGLAAPIEEMLGRNIAEILPPDIASAYFDAIDRALSTSTVQTIEYPLQVLSGAIQHFEARVVRCGEEDVIAIVRDVTQRKHFEQTLIRARDTAEEMPRMKDAFLANMSHEIRTPLTSIIGFSDVLMDETSGDLSEMARLIKVGGERLMMTLESVLDLANLESGSVVLKPRQVDLVEQVRSLLPLLAPEAESKGLYLEIEKLQEELITKIDPVAFARVFNNVLANALKFTLEGGITIRLWAAEESAVVSVVDTGIGIDSDFRPKLFDEFAQESHGLARSYEGAGLGLAIARRLVDLMQGRIDVRSRKGEGTTFTLIFPR